MLISSAKIGNFGSYARIKTAVFDAKMLIECKKRVVCLFGASVLRNKR